MCVGYVHDSMRQSVFAKVIYHLKVGRNSNLSYPYIHVAGHVNTNGNICFCLPSKLALPEGILVRKDPLLLDIQVPETFPYSFFILHTRILSYDFFRYQSKTDTFRNFRSYF